MNKLIPLILTAALALGLASCSKDEPVTPAVGGANESVGSPADAAGKTAEAARAEAAKAAEALKAEAASVADVAKAEAEKAADAAKVEAAKPAEATKAADNARAQGLIDEAKTLIAAGKYSDAATLLQQLGGQSLSADQTTLVASLKEQIQKALATKTAENAAGNLLRR